MARCTNIKVVLLLRSIIGFKGIHVESISKSLSDSGGWQVCLLHNKPLQHLIAYTMTMLYFSWVCTWGWVLLGGSLAPWMTFGAGPPRMNSLLHGFLLSAGVTGVVGGWLGLSLSFQVVFLCCWTSCQSGSAVQGRTFQEDKPQVQALIWVMLAHVQLIKASQ